MGSVVVEVVVLAGDGVTTGGVVEVVKGVDVETRVTEVFDRVEGSLEVVVVEEVPNKAELAAYCKELTLESVNEIVRTASAQLSW